MKNREKWPDNIKTIACILVVLGHIIQSFQKAKIINYDGFLSYINWFIYLFHMPVFMCVSGYLYSKYTHIENKDDYIEFIKKKFINLIIPYIIFYLIYIILNVTFSSSVNTKMGINELIGIINNPIPPYWYLYALLSLFLIVPILEKLFKHNRKNIFILMLFLKIISIFYTCPIYAIKSVLEWGIYFYLGAVIDDKIFISKNNYQITILYVLLATIYYWIGLPLNYEIKSIINIIFGISGTLIMINNFYNIKDNKFFEIVKKHTMPIFLLHTIFAAGARIVLIKMNIDSYIIHMIIGMMFGIGGPILIGIMCDKTKYANMLFYPLTTYKKLKEGK